MAANGSLINGPSAGCEDVAVPFHLQSEPYPCRRGGDGTTTRPHKQDPGFNSYATFLHSIAIPQESVAGTMSRRVAIDTLDTAIALRPEAERYLRHGGLTKAKHTKIEM